MDELVGEFLVESFENLAGSHRLHQHFIFFEQRRWCAKQITAQDVSLHPNADGAFGHVQAIAVRSLMSATSKSYFTVSSWWCPSAIECATSTDKTFADHTCFE